MTDTVLVTGISGFIASHVAHKLLEQGYAVRGTVRNKDKGQKTVDRLLAKVPDGNVELVEANLASDAGWADAVKDCRFIQHIASPFPNDPPDDREALVPEARAGAQRVLEHGFSAGTDRIILTSSMVSMMGRPTPKGVVIVNEDDWTDPDWRPLGAYAVSKARAELSAWAYAKAQNLSDKLVTVNPGLVLGPDMFENAGTSVGIVYAMLKGNMSKTPKVAFPIIDVRDCAAIHVAAMRADNVGGRRLMAAGETLWLKDVAAILKSEFPKARDLPSGEVPNWLMTLSGLFDDRAKRLVPNLGKFYKANADYVSTLTQVMPRSAKEAVLSTAHSLIENGKINIDT